MKRIQKRTRTANKLHNRPTADALDILDRITGRDEPLRSMIAAASTNAQVAELILAGRERAGLTQAELAERVGTSQSVIARLENADYTGHSLTMLQRIAAALGQNLEVRFTAPKRTKTA